MLCIVLMMIGVFSFSFAIGSLSSVLSTLDSKQAKLKEKLNTLNEINQSYNLNYDLYRRLRHCLKYDHNKDASD